MSDSNSTELHSTPRQGELKPLLGSVRLEPEEVPWELVAKCKNEDEAILLCVHYSRLANQEIAKQLGIDKSHWTRIMQGRGNLPGRKRTPLMSICGNIAPIQWEAMRFRRKLVEHDVAREKQELLARLAKIQAQEYVMGMAA